jgi:SAM-dependent methyltransferase
VVLESPVGDAYAGLAQAYIDLFGMGRHEHADDLAFIAEHLAGRSGPVLDVGCGPGHLSGYLASLGVDVAGVDLVPDFVRHAQDANPTLAFTVGSMRQLEVADGFLDGILAWYSLIHERPEDVDGVLREFGRALASGGALVIGLFDGEYIAPFAHKVVTAYTWPLAHMTVLLERAGFSVTGSIQRGADGDRRAHLAVAARAS